MWGGEKGVRDLEAAKREDVQFDPSLIPPECVEHLTRETLRLVRWMMTIPKYREAIRELTAARRAAREREGR